MKDGRKDGAQSDAQEISFWHHVLNHSTPVPEELKQK